MFFKIHFPYWNAGIIYILVSLLTVSTPIYPGVDKINNFPDDLNGELDLTGPENLCAIFGGIIGVYSGGGDPSTDVYTWLVTSQNGDVIFNQSGGGEQYETVNIPFNDVGEYQVSLSVRRNNINNFFEQTLTVKVQKGPVLALEPDYLLCGTGYVDLFAIDPVANPNFNDYTIIWKDVLENEIARGNNIQAYYEGYYKVEIFLTNSEGGQDCLITASTFVGPPSNFEIIQSSEEICRGESITFSLDTPIFGEWFIRKDTETEKVSLGDGYEKLISPNNIDGTGYFEVYFRTSDPEFPDCISERRKFFFVNEPPKINTNITNRPNDCTDFSGSFDVVIDSEIDSLVIPQLGLKESGFAIGETVSYSNLKPNLYTVIAFYKGCKTTSLVVLESIISPELDIDLKTTPETCDEKGVLPGYLAFELLTPLTGTYHIVKSGVGEIKNGVLDNDIEKTINLDNGTYFLVIYDGNCPFFTEEFIISKANQVEFSIPKEINICEKLDLNPTSNLELSYLLTYPDGHEEKFDSESSVTLMEPGEYEILGTAKDTLNGLCPLSKKFTVSLSPAISFDVKVKEEDCFGGKVFEAEINGISPEDASIRWQNADGEIVGRSPIFYPTAFGTYSLIVQPRKSSACLNNKLYFEYESPILNIEIDLDATKICPNPYESIITFSTDEEEIVSTIKWIFFDLNDNRQDLTDFDGLHEITVSEIGTYEVVVYNKLGCELGRNQIEVEESTFTTAPQVEDSYAFCSIENNTIPAIDPGDFATYSWFHEDQLVSTSPTYKPKQIGDYVLVVTTEDGCEFTAEFNTYDACNFQVVYPNAMILNQADKDFRVLISEGVSEAELFVLNRQGTLIHHELTNEFPVETPILQWDGTINGKNIPSGTYVVILLLRNNEFGFEDKITSSLLVIE